MVTPLKESDIAKTGENAATAQQMRIFVGVKVAPGIAGDLAGLARELEHAAVRLVRIADIHLTLVPPWNETSLSQIAEKIRATINRFEPFTLTFRRLCYGPRPERPRLLWAECVVSNEVELLRAELLNTCGASDERPFRPHVTLARLRGDGRAIARRHPIDRELSFTQRVDSIEIFRSPPPGATGYEILASLPLTEGRRSALEA